MSLINTEVKPFKATRLSQWQACPVDERHPEGQMVRGGVLFCRFYVRLPD